MNYNRGGRGWGPPRGPPRGGFGRGSFRGRGGWSNFGGPREAGWYRGRPQNFGRNDQKWERGPKRERPGKRLSEDEIGVTEYVSDHEGFLGIIKSRYSDFQVSEINERGEIAKLTDLDPPPPPVATEVEEDEDLLLDKYSVEILPMETWDRINGLLQDGGEDRVEVDVTGMTKEQRTKIHDAVKRAFGDSVVGSTVAVDEKKFVRFDRYKEGVRIDKRVKWQWGGEYVHFIVYKENKDTMEAAQTLAERLRLNIRPSMLGYAGTKDRRAKSSQWFSLRKVDPRKIAIASKGMRELHVGNYSFSNTHLKLGMLQGNQFRIALRNVTASEECVRAACTLLQERGFINYYGLQRFGTRVEMPTYKIGLNLLKKNFKDAIAGILLEREGLLQTALRVYAAEGAAAALEVWPRRAPKGCSERRLVKALADSPNDLQGAVNKLARNTRLLYVHSYQSLVWNRSASERVRRGGLKPMEGDLVAEECVTEEILPESIEEIEKEELDPEDGQDGGGDKITDDASAPNLLESSRKPKNKVPVKVLTKEDVDSGKYTIFDIVLPLPGYLIEYPPNMKDYYVKLLSEDCVSMDLDKKFRSFSMSGAYRHLVARPGNFSWQVVRYTDPHADLIASDMDQMQNRELDGIIPDGKYKALLLTMNLPASCYATMALRELLKVDTACDNQALQNNYHKKKDDVKTNQDDVETEKKDIETVDQGQIGKESESKDVKSESGDKKSESNDEESENGDEKCACEESKMEIEDDKSESEKTCKTEPKMEVQTEVDSQSGNKRKAESSIDGLHAKISKQE